MNIFKNRCIPQPYPIIPNRFELSSPDNLKSVIIEVNDNRLIIHNYNGFEGFCVTGNSEDLARLKTYLEAIKNG